MKDNFDVHAWNLKRYLNENENYLDQLASDLSLKYPNLDFYVRDEPYFDRIDVIGSEQDKFNFGDKFHGKKFGEYEVFAIDDDDRGEVVRIVKSSSIKRGGINEYSKYDNIASYGYKGYKDKHFDICPAAEGLRDRLLAGEFKDNNWATGTDFEKEVGEWLYRHDILFQIEKQVLRDKEGEESDVEEAEHAVSKIINLSRDLGIPAAEISYLKAHIKKIKDIVEYSSLTEEDRFAGSDPRGGSTIKGTGFDWKRKEKKSLPLKLQWQGDFPSQQEVDDAFSSWQRETHYLASKPVEKWDEYDLSNFNAISRKGGKIQ